MSDTPKKKTVTVEKPESQPTGTTPAAKPLATKQWRGQETYEHSLYKLMPAQCKKNRSFKPGAPKIEELPHGHKYHSMNRKGTPNEYCAPTAGHFHQVKAVWDGDNLVSLECGPPLRFRWRQMKSGRMKKVLERIVYEQDEDLGAHVEDNHTHEIEYIRSEVLSLQHNQAQAPMPNFVRDKHGDEAYRVAQSALRD